MARKRRRRRNRRGYVTRPYTAKQLRRLANRLVAAQLNPQRREIEREMRLSGKAITGFTEALADELGGIAPAVQGAYSQAAGAQNSFAQGFADGLRQNQAQVGQESADFLDTVGANTGQTPDTTGGADVLFGSSGFIPASTLNQAGAAASAHAAQLPGFAARTGQDALIASQFQGRQALDELRKRRPELFQEALNNLLQFELSKFGAKINAGYLSNAQAQTRLDAALGFAGLEADRAEARSKNRKEKREKRQDRRQDAWKDFQRQVWSRADNLSEGRKIPNPNYKPGIPDVPLGSNPTHITQKYTYTQAYNLLWRALGQPLRRMGIRENRIKSYIRRALEAHGFNSPSPGSGAPSGENKGDL